MTEMPELMRFCTVSWPGGGTGWFLTVIWYHDASLAPVLVNIHLTEVFLGILLARHYWIDQRLVNCAAKFQAVDAA